MARSFLSRFLMLLGILTKALTSWSPRLNKAVWNAQYRFGRWDYLDEGTACGRELAKIIETYAPAASILDLGCGTTVNLPLTPGTYRHYHGVDISAKAIEQARLVGRPDATYETADILSYTPPETHDAILLREVIYYLPVAKISGFLSRLSGFLAPGGVILIQVWSGEQTPALIAAIKESGLPLILEKAQEEGGTANPMVYLLGKRDSEVPPSASA